MSLRSVMIIKGECDLSRSMVLNKTICNLNLGGTFKISTGEATQPIPPHIDTILLISTNKENMRTQAEVINESVRDRGLTIMFYGTPVDLKSIKKGISSNHNLVFIAPTHLLRTFKKRLKQKLVS